MPAASLSQWPRLSVLLDELLDLDASAQSRRLAALRQEDAGLADAAAALLGRISTVEREGFLQHPPRLPDEVQAGQTVGAYQIEREIGQGGMGTVWLARRTDGRFEGQVAIKFLAAGFATRGGAARFTREGSLLARLAHPHIARLLDAGLVEGQRPYLVLEYVDGAPIDEYCQRAGLDTRARVQLCLDVLDAVVHAHARLILHRDIKPGNILVSAGGEVKLLDFGIAKLLDDQTGSGRATELTRESGHAYTMLYAAPEQVQGGEVTTATDVFALGVLLHLLLTGRHPNGIADTPMERMRRLVELEPPPMSVALLQAPPPGQPAAADGARRARVLRGDLDTIVAKSLKKLPAERYANAEQLAEDLRRWLHDEPILARADARLYRLRKFVARYRTGVALGVLTLAGLSAGITVALWQAAEARGQHARAEGLIEFMLGDLRGKLQPVGRLDALDVVGEKALNYYALQDDARLDADALGRRARAMHLIGEIADTRGKLDDASRRFTEAEKSTAALLSREPANGQRLFDHAQSVYWVGHIAWRQGRLPEAQSQFERYLALALQLVALDPAKPEWRAEQAYAHQNLGTVLLARGHFEAASAALLKAQSEFRALRAALPALTTELTNNLSLVARTQDRLGQIGQAITTHRARIALLPQGEAQVNRRAQREVATSLCEISRLELSRGQPGAAREPALAALRILQPLSEFDATNTSWRNDLAIAHLRLAFALNHLPGEADSARVQALSAMRIAQALLAVDPSIQRLRLNLLGMSHIAQAKTARPAEAQAAWAALAQWLGAADPNSSDVTVRSLVAQAAVMLGDHAARGDAAAQAQGHWQLALAQVGDDSRAEPAAIGYVAVASLRLGQLDRARQLAARLDQTEFRHPDLVGLTHILGRQ